MVVQGTLYKIPLTPVYLYAPNSDDDQFFLSFANIPNLNSHHLIVRGEFRLIIFLSTKSFFQMSDSVIMKLWYL